MKKCFFVTPIGLEGSQERKVSDFVMSVYLSPTLEKLDYKVERADSSKTVERIDTSILVQLKTADLVIADVSGNNPNVMFELGYRIALNKPFIIIAQDVNELPFDISSIRTLFYETIAPNILQFNADLEKTVKNISNNFSITNESKNKIESKADTSQTDDPNYQAGKKIGEELILDAIKNKDFTTLKDFAEIAKTFGIGATENQ